MVRARVVSATTRPSKTTRTRLGLGAIAMGWSVRFSMSASARRPSLHLSRDRRDHRRRAAALENAAAHEVDVLAEHVELIRERAGQLERDDALLDLVEAVEEIGALLGRGLAEGHP